MMRLLFLALLAPGCDQRHRKPRPAELACAKGYIADSEVCVPEACGTGTWGDLPVDAATVYVDAAAAEGGDGSAEAPLRTLQPALDLAGERGGGLVAVAGGTYPETLTLTSDHAGVHLAGRCRELVTLDASVGDEGTAGIDIDSRLGEVEVSGLSVVGSDGLGVWMTSGVVRLVDSRVEGSARVGIEAGRWGTMAPTRLEVEGCDLVGNTMVGLWAYDPGTEVTLVDTAIRNTQPTRDGEYGFGILIDSGASLSIEGCEIIGNSIVGLLAIDSGSDVTLVGTSIRDTVPNGDGEYGYGINAQGGAELRAAGCELVGNTAVGLAVGDTDTMVALADTTIGNTQHDENGETGHGIDVFGGATLAADSCELVGNTEMGVAAKDPGTEVMLVDTVVRGTQSNGNGEGGYGINVWAGAALWAETCELADNTKAGVVADGQGTEVVLVRTTVSNTQPDGNGEGGHGLEVWGGAALSAESCELTGNTGVGVLAGEPGTGVTYRGSSVTETMVGFGSRSAVAIGLCAQDGASISASGLLARDNEGPGLYAVSGGILGCTGCSLLDNRFAGAVAVNEGTLEIRSSTITGTRESVDLGGGVGIYAANQWDGGPPSLVVSDSTISDHLVASVWLSGDGSYQLTDNQVSGGIGVLHGTGTRCGDGVFARGVAAWDGTTGLLLDSNALTGNAGAGLLLDDAHAQLAGNAWTGNAPDLWVQGEACLSPLDGYYETPEYEICPEWDRPTCDLAFALNLVIEDIDPALPSTPLQARHPLAPPPAPLPALPLTRPERLVPPRPRLLDSVPPSP